MVQEVSFGVNDCGKCADEEDVTFVSAVLRNKNSTQLSLLSFLAWKRQSRLSSFCLALSLLKFYKIWFAFFLSVQLEMCIFKYFPYCAHPRHTIISDVRGKVYETSSKSGKDVGKIILLF